MACKKILIIDDDKELCEELVEFLQAEGYAAECASDSIDGEKLVRSKKYDMVLLDYKMPVLTGVDLLKRLKADNIRERIFIISGRPSVGRALKDEDLADMIRGVIAKPINFETLLENIRNE